MTYSHGGFRVDDKVKFVRFIDTDGNASDGFSKYMKSLIGGTGVITALLDCDTPNTLMMLFHDRDEQISVCPEELKNLEGE